MHFQPKVAWKSYTPTNWYIILFSHECEINSYLLTFDRERKARSHAFVFFFFKSLSCFVLWRHDVINIYFSIWHDPFFSFAHELYRQIKNDFFLTRKNKSSFRKSPGHCTNALRLLKILTLPNWCLFFLRKFWKNQVPKIHPTFFDLILFCRLSFNSFWPFAIGFSQ